MLVFSLVAAAWWWSREPARYSSPPEPVAPATQVSSPPRSTPVAIAENPEVAAAADSGWMSLAGAALDDLDPAVRLESAHLLGERGDLLSLQILEQALYDSDRRVRAVAMDALSENLGVGIQDILVRALAHQDPQIRNLARDLLDDIP
jgi:HEAT repeat protein